MSGKISGNGTGLEWRRGCDERKHVIVGEGVFGELCERNCLQLWDMDVGRLWECVGEMDVGIRIRLQSLYERANKMNDVEFMEWLKTEYHIKIQICHLWNKLILLHYFFSKEV